MSTGVGCEFLTTLKKARQRIVGNKTVPENSQQHYELILDPNFIKLSKNETDVATFNIKFISSAQIGKKLEKTVHGKHKI